MGLLYRDMVVGIVVPRHGKDMVWELLYDMAGMMVVTGSW